VNSNSGHSTFDRDLDVPPPARPSPEYDEVRTYYRLVVNPFLAILGWLVAIGVCRFGLEWRRPMVTMAAFGLFVASFLLFQFHCLDCGKTDFLHRRRRHRCEAVWNRWRTGLPNRWRVPGIKLQLLIWFYLIASVSILIATAMPRHRR
jgi:hypothetical protein